LLDKSQPHAGRSILHTLEYPAISAVCNALGTKRKAISMSESTPQFENLSLVGALFTDVNLSASRFNDVNIRGANFVNVALTGATFRDANFSHVSVDDCNLDGMRIDGVLVSELLAAYRNQA
jgi:uncharacterized protein YjbI with pentapeptide repeats